VSLRPSVVTTSTTTAARDQIGKVVNLPGVGLWVLDVDTASLRRLRDPAPASLSGASVFFAEGRDVSSMPLAGGPAIHRYTVPDFMSDSWVAPPYKIDHSRERVTGIEMSPDGHAAVYVQAPTVPNGGIVGDSALLDPSGKQIALLDNDWPYQWTSDGTALVAWKAGAGLEAIRPDGSLLWGPVPNNQVYPRHLRVSRDGSTVLLSSSSNVMGAEGDVWRFDVRALAFTHMQELRGTPAFAPDGRIIAPRGPAAGGTTPEIKDDVIFDPRSGRVTTYAFPGDSGAWSSSPDRIVSFGPGLHPPQSQPTFRLLTAQADAVLTLDAHTLCVAPTQEGGGSASGWWAPPTWSVDGKSILFTATALGGGPGTF